MQARKGTKGASLERSYLCKKNDVFNNTDVQNQDETQDQNAIIHNTYKNTQRSMSLSVDNLDETVVFVHICWPTGARS